MADRSPPRARSRRGQDAAPADDEVAGTRRIAGTVAVVGYPNVGKSTLVNRLTGRRDTVVHEQPGVTRDRKELEFEWRGQAVRIVDTGGIDLVEGGSMGRQVAEQARYAIAEADLVLFVVDGQAGLGPGDDEVAAILRRADVPVIVVVTKRDNPDRHDGAPEFWALGLGEPIEVSGIHGTASGDLLDRILDELGTVEGAARDEGVSEEIGVAILGRPNVGKSSLLNALTGTPRVIVSDVPGTTRDAIDTRLVRDDTVFRLIDTAGMRRKRKHRQDVEFWSEMRALDAARRADVALVLVDASEGVTDSDLAVADEARKAGCATIVVVSKWDIVEIDLDDLRARINEKLRQRPPVITTSAVTPRGLDRVLNTIEEVYARYTSRVSTGILNRLLAEIAEARQPSLRHGRRLKMLYGAQVQTRPPRFRITVNDRRLITRDYGYYVENRLREELGLEGCPVIVDFIAR
ncbi:MAG: GTP-binding protein EngA [uncultured Thermoleophilia bacterium]|uniref:GTPase Der n=1 Tax=uncultured Thermoleophilia bacterium TaxID=1497501 RepID=A0A6J4U528_9ACTN|nr:MAG: GTP-binding protein EngA [uncultured Thermoleophilia bacterium]